MNPSDNQAAGHPLTEKTIHSAVMWQGRIATVRRDQALAPDGQSVEREVVEHPGGVVICPVLPDGRLLLVEQWRYPLGRPLLEFPAGKLDWHDGVPEDPLRAAQRELGEETGYAAAQWTAVTHIYTAPGFCNEKLWLYQATDLSPSAQHQPDADEHLRVVRLTPAQIWQQIRQGEMVDAKTVALFSLCFTVLQTR